MIYWRRLSDRLVRFWFPLLVAFVLFISWSPLNASPVAKAEKDGVTITLFDEACKLDSVKNLQYRATWTEKSRSFEGCFSVQGGIVIFFWSDLTVGLAPGQAFAPLTGS